MTKTEDELFTELSKLPDFENYALPARWFKKYNLKPVEARNTREFIKEVCMLTNVPIKHYVDKPIVITTPQPGGVRPVLPPIDAPMTIESREISQDELSFIK
jgi:hypothetical protein